MLNGLEIGSESNQHETHIYKHTLMTMYDSENLERKSLWLQLFFDWNSNNTRKGQTNEQQQKNDKCRPQRAHSNILRVKKDKPRARERASH